MKLIVRADDLGISQAVNYGISKAVTDGIVTAVGLMPNMESASHGYALLRRSKVCLGQHTNISLGKPVCDPALIPSLVDTNGDFHSSKTIAKRKSDTIDIEECEKEIEAQLQRFVEITGQSPDYFEGHFVASPNYYKALANVALRNNLFYDAPGFDRDWEEETGIFGLTMMPLDQANLYDPKAYFEDNLERIKSNSCSIAVFHPGFLDQDILDSSSFTLIRPMECDFLCSQWVKDFIDDNGIELVDFTNYRG